jgi:hypothetical protein
MERKDLDAWSESIALERPSCAFNGSDGGEKDQDMTARLIGEEASHCRGCLVFDASF